MKAKSIKGSSSEEIKIALQQNMQDGFGSIERKIQTHDLLIKFFLQTKTK